MNMKSMARLFGVLVLMVSGSVFAQIQVPNTFQSGQPARAAEVNDNFTVVTDAVNTNASAIQNLEGAQDLMGPHVALADSNQMEVGVAQNVFQATGTNYALVWLQVAGKTVPFFAYENFTYDDHRNVCEIAPIERSVDSLIWRKISVVLGKQHE